jgi:hypothetical protein
LTPAPSANPFQFAVKCPCKNPDGSECGGVRVFSVLEAGKPPGLSEIESSLRSYSYIRELGKAAGYRKQVAVLLESACELHLLGQLEADATSEEAAYNGAAVFVGMAAELFLRRWIGYKHQGRKLAGRRGRPLRKVPRLKPLKPGHKHPVLVSQLKGARKGALKPDADHAEVARALNRIFALRDAAAHPVIDRGAARHSPSLFVPAQGTVDRALGEFELVSRAAAWVQ